MSMQRHAETQVEDFNWTLQDHTIYKFDEEDSVRKYEFGDPQDESRALVVTLYEQAATGRLRINGDGPFRYIDLEKHGKDAIDATGSSKVEVTTRSETPWTDIRRLSKALEIAEFLLNLGEEK
jgi:hypothetical protein